MSNSEHLQNYLKYFLYHEITEKTFEITTDNLLKLKINTYCYLLNATQYSKEGLISCLNEVSLETLKNNLSKNEIGTLKELESEFNLSKAPEELLDILLADWKSLESLVGIYYFQLKETYKILNRKIDRIIVYEAPPFGKDHFFITGGNYLTSIIFRSDSDIKKITDSFIGATLENIKQVINSGIVYIDLTMIPLPLTSKIRSAWSKETKYCFGGKQLTVLMLEWALEKLKSRFEEDEPFNNPFSSTCQIAIGTPINTSASIFEFFSDKLLKIDEAVYFDLSTVNSPEVFKKKKYLRGHTLNQFKFNVIDNTTPTYKFVKNAFDLL